MLKRSKLKYLRIVVIAAFSFIACLLGFSLLKERYGGITETYSKVEGISSYQQDTIQISILFNRATKYISSNTDSAILLINQALRLNDKYKNNTIEVKALSQLASCYIRKGDYNKTVAILDTAFKKAQTINDADMVAVLYNASAILYQQNGQYTKSIYNYFEGLNTLQEQGLSGSLRAAKMYNNLAGLFILLQESGQALKFLNEARKILDPLNPEHKVTLTYVLCNSGIIKASKKEEDAKEELKQALQLSNDINDPYLSNKILINLSDIYLSQGSFLKADELLLEAFTTAQRSKNPISMILTEYGIGHSLSYRKDYKKALPSLVSAYEDSKKTGYTDALLVIITDLKSCYYGVGDYKRAYELQEEYAILKDSLQQKEKKQSFEMLLEYQASEKDKKIAQSQLEITKQQSALKEKNLWIGVFVFGTVLLSILFMVVYINNRNKQHLQAEQLKNIEQQRRIERLTAAFEGEEQERARISRDIHDGVMTTFATVKMKINRLEKEVVTLGQRTDYKQTMALFDKATTELRLTAHNLMPDLLLEEGLTKAIFYFVKSIEEHTGIKITFEHFGEIPKMQQNFSLFLYRSIQELIQNVIKHAAASEVFIQMIYRNDTLNITVEDNGRGFADGMGDGLGLKSLNNKVRLYHGELQIESKENAGTSITLDFYGIQQYEKTWQ